MMLGRIGATLPTASNQAGGVDSKPPWIRRDTVEGTDAPKRRGIYIRRRVVGFKEKPSKEYSY